MRLVCVTLALSWLVAGSALSQPRDPNPPRRPDRNQITGPQRLVRPDSGVRLRRREQFDLNMLTRDWRSPPETADVFIPMPGTGQPMEVKVIIKDGRMFWGDVEILEQTVMKVGPNIMFSANVATATGWGLWPASTIYYDETSIPLFNGPQQTLIRNGIDILNNSTNLCLVPRDDSATSWISFYPHADRNSAPLGNFVAGDKLVNLRNDGNLIQRNVVHEILHTAGFIHEHQRANRDSFVSVNMLAVPLSRWPDYMATAWPGVGPYDTASIMHYSGTLAGGTVVMTSPPGPTGTAVPLPLSLSATDIAGINALYPAPPSCPIPGVTPPPTVACTPETVTRWKTSRSRGDPRPMGCANNEDYDGGFCYPRCRNGFVGRATMCWQRSCPNRYTDLGATCHRPVRVIGKSYTRGAGTPLPCAAGQREENFLCYTPCRQGFRGEGPVCWRRRCPNGWVNEPATCRLPEDTIEKESYDRGAGTAVDTCPAGTVNDAGLCYPRCPVGYSGVGPLCWTDCAGGFTDFGAFCQRVITQCGP